MIPKKLEKAVNEAGLKIDCTRLLTGKKDKGFFAFEIGCGADIEKLQSLKKTLCEAFAIPRSAERDFCSLEVVDNKDHEDYGKPYLLFTSVWCA